MHSSINLFIVFSFLVLFLNPKYMRPLLLSSSSEIKLFELNSIPRGHLTFLGDSRMMQYKEIALTKEGMPTNAPRSTGVVLYNHPIFTKDFHSTTVPSFYTKFAFSIDNYGDGEAIGDGLAFFISPSNDFLGSPGYMGLVDSTDLSRNKFIAIEFDIKRDFMFHDPDDNHVGLDVNNLFSIKQATCSSLGVNLKSGNLIRTWIDYKSTEKRLEVFLSYSYSKPKEPLLKVNIDLSDFAKENMFVGFSAATEGSMQATHIEEWEFTVVRLSPPPPSPPELGRPIPNSFESAHSNLSRIAVGLTVGVCSVPFMVFFGWFCWKKVMAMIQKSEQTNNLGRQIIRSTGGFSSQEIQLFTLVDEIARGLNVEKVLDDEGELIHVETFKSSIPLCNSLPAAKPRILPLCNGMPLGTNNITPSDDG